jgi:hypothetical protein
MTCPLSFNALITTYATTKSWIRTATFHLEFHNRIPLRRSARLEMPSYGRNKVSMRTGWWTCEQLSNEEVKFTFKVFKSLSVEHTKSLLHARLLCIFQVIGCDVDVGRCLGWFWHLNGTDLLCVLVFVIVVAIRPVLMTHGEWMRRAQWEQELLTSGLLKLFGCCWQLVHQSAIERQLHFFWKIGFSPLNVLSDQVTALLILMLLTACKYIPHFQSIPSLSTVFFLIFFL